MKSLQSIADIADETKSSPERIAYCIRKFRVKPARWVGRTRLFSRRQVSQIIALMETVQTKTKREAMKAVAS